MSRERELLQRVLDGDADRHWTISSRLYKEIEAVLNQPEQEPVAWMNDSGGCFLSDGNKYSENWTALYSAPISDITGEDLMKQVKSNRVFYQEGYAQAEIDLKREPLSEQFISVANQSSLEVTRLAFRQGVRFAEKCHGII